MKIIVVSAIITLIFTGIAGYLGNLRVKTTKDFITGGSKLGVLGLTSMLMGTIIGGAATVGTVQMAYNHGVVAIWFITGLSIASIILGLFYSKQADRKNFETIPQIIGSTYGKKSRTCSSLLLSMGMFIHVNGQVIACSALFTAIFGIGMNKTTGIVVLLLVTYVVFGGFWGSAVVGGIKTVLLYVTSLICGGILIFKLNAPKEIITFFPKDPWLNLFSGSISEDIASVLSTIVGILSTQTFFQTIIAGKNSKVSRKSAFLTAFFVLPVGIICTFIGMYMRIHYPGIQAKEAFPLFLIKHLHPVIAGISIATILISSIAAGAGLSLGIATMFARDIYKTIINPSCSDKKQLAVLKVSIIIIGIATFFIVIKNKNSMILEWGFISMVFRATPIFVPTLVAMLFKDKINPKAGIYAIILAPVMSGLWIILGLPKISSIYVGLITSATVLLVATKYFDSKNIKYNKTV
ncbi:sodium:solute symporter family protein [Clostridium brassicae]|uniref:Sodium:solute symporter family protein n=1 Tax=Clostridium brassicae TaxID=2999072 RepID=A0ABT4D9T2_9CLOT|nr:sodium:solute symporter family protein [Clostridium brassicae]MCY6959066.1 sodium:solute symporter family protein [Clostridium brassicae]